MQLGVGPMLKKLATICGSQGAKDLLRDLVEDGLARILAESWTWNWKEQSYILPATVFEGAGTWTYAEGDDFIELDVPIADLDYFHAGRRIRLGAHWYRVLDVALRDPSRVYLDRAVEEDGEVEAEELLFYRDELCVKSSSIRNVSTDLTTKLARYSPEYFKSNFRLHTLDTYEPGEPSCYQDNQPYEIAPPAFAPTVTASATAGTFSLGVYYYYWTRFDSESKLESMPSPVTTYEATSTNWPQVLYGNPTVADTVEVGTSYGLRLWRSKVNPDRENCPMYLIYERAPSASSPADQDRVTEAARPAKERKWIGKQTVCRLIPCPSDKIRRISIDALKSFGYRLEDTDSFEDGDKGELTELLNLYVYTHSRYTGREGDAKRGSAVDFNSQLKYLLNQDRQPGNADVGPENYHHARPGAGLGSDVSWVNALPWSGKGYEVP